MFGCGAVYIAIVLLRAGTLLGFCAYLGLHSCFWSTTGSVEVSLLAGLRTTCGASGQFWVSWLHAKQDTCFTSWPWALHSCCGPHMNSACGAHWVSQTAELTGPHWVLMGCPARRRHSLEACKAVCFCHSTVSGVLANSCFFKIKWH